MNIRYSVFVYYFWTIMYAKFVGAFVECGICLKNRENIRLLLLLSLVLCVLATGIFGTAFSLVRTSGTVAITGGLKVSGHAHTLGIYWDSACTNRTSSISWGILEPGSNRTVTVYIRNEGNTVVTLTETVQNWIHQRPQATLL